jgi:hypothetical protein
MQANETRPDTAFPPFRKGNDGIVPAAARFWLWMMFAAVLIIPCRPSHAQEAQGTGSALLPPGSNQTAESILAPPTGLRIVQNNEETKEGEAPGRWSGTSPHMDKGATQRREPPRPDTTLDTEKMNTGPAPDTENINKDTTGPGGDNMMRDAIPGGSGLNRE